MPEWLLQLASLLVAGGAIYGGIRSDLRNTHELAKDAKAVALDAQQKIFNHIAGGNHG
jgi:hypothetical protein